MSVSILLSSSSSHLTLSPVTYVKWADPYVYTPLALTFLFLLAFLLIEAHLAIEPILPTYLLSHRVPVLVGTSSALVAVCNLSVSYHFPMFFQTVMGTSASVAGECRVLLLNGKPLMDHVRTSPSPQQRLHFDWIDLCGVRAHS